MTKDLPNATRLSNRKFTGLKMDWDDALMYDSRLSNAATRLGFVMMQFANEEADDPFFIWPSIETLAHEAGAMCDRHVRDSLKLLIRTGWMRRETTWRADKRHNSYTLLFDNVQPLLDAKRLQRKLRREKIPAPECRLTPLEIHTRKKRVRSIASTGIESESLKIKELSSEAGLRLVRGGRA